MIKQLSSLPNTFREMDSRSASKHRTIMLSGELEAVLSASMRLAVAI